MTPNTESALLAELSRMGALVKKLTEEKEALREALMYAKPIIEKYGWTQGNIPSYHAELIAPVDAALGKAKFVCSLNDPDCTKNCGNYGCGN